MLITVSELERRWGLKPNSILHIGAHEAEEAEAYEQAGWGRSRTVWVEADPETTSRLQHRLAHRGPHHHVIQALAWDNSGDEVLFQRTNNSQSSSALPLKDHSIVYPDISVNETIRLTTSRLDEVLPVELSTFDFINLDIQGAELHALRGMGDLLDSATAVYSEVSRRELYEGSPSIEELDDWLSRRGFSLVGVRWVPQGWGDGIWLRDTPVHSPGSDSFHWCFSRLKEHLVYAGRWMRWRASTVLNRFQSA